MCPRQGDGKGHSKGHSSRNPEQQPKLSAINDQSLIRREGPLVAPKQRINFSVKAVPTVLKSAFSSKPDLSLAVRVS